MHFILRKSLPIQFSHYESLALLVFVPVFLLLLGALVILIIQRSSSGFGISWVVGVGVSGLAWVIILVFRWLTPAPFILENWYPLTGTQIALIFAIDPINWVYAFSLVSILLAILLTAPVRLQQHISPYSWAGSLAVGGIGLIATFAGNPWSLVLGWCSIDLLEIALTLVIINERQFNTRVVLAFAARITGVVLVLGAIGLGISQGLSTATSTETSAFTGLTFNNVTPETGLILLIAVGLRLGVIPFHLPFSTEPPTRRGLGVIIRLVGPASSLVVLSRLENLVMPSTYAVVLSGFSVLAALYGGAMWLGSKDELEGRSYWMIALTGLAIACVVRGQAGAASAWGATLLLAGAMLFLFSFRTQRYLIILLLGFLNVTGIPFTPPANGWSGIIVYPFNILDILFFIAHILILLGFLRHAIRKEELTTEIEPWSKVIYPLGLALPALAGWMIGLNDFIVKGRAFPDKVWWGGILTTAISLGIFYAFYRWAQFQNIQRPRILWFTSTIGRIGKVMAGFFSMNWVYGFIFMTFLLLQEIIRLVTTLLEGDGGILWSILLLVLLLSLLKSGAGL